MTQLLTITIGGLIAGTLAGFLGIGGGTVLVPLLVALGYEPVQAVATSSLSIVITAISGTLQNWRMGYLNWTQVAGIGFPAILTAQFGAELSSRIPRNTLLIAFGCLLLFNVYLIQVRQKISSQQKARESATNLDQLSPENPQPFNPLMSQVFTGSAAGILAGLFGVGGGIIMVPLQILLLGTSIKVAIQTSLGVIVITAISATVGHALRENVLWVPGILLGLGGLTGAQVSTRLLPKLPDDIITLAFRSLLLILAIYIFWQAT